MRDTGGLVETFFCVLDVYCLIMSVRADGSEEMSVLAQDAVEDLVKVESDLSSCNSF